MNFASIEFGFLLITSFWLYWFVFRSRESQNLLLIAASALFYGWWDYRFLALIAFSTWVDFWVGLKLDGTAMHKQRRAWMWLSVGVNLGLLGTFKYFNFFTESLQAALLGLGIHAHNTTLQLVLPVGISFYTFQTMSYTLDIYRGHLKPTRDFAAFAAFVSFFPQLVAGPIERASNLLPQFLKDRTFNPQQATMGLQQILWGLFKKLVVADNAAQVVDVIFAHYADLTPGMLAIGAFLFAIQIYGDFSGYSDIAIGTARLFGFTLQVNFKTPYFSSTISEFWQRWHISLSSWFKDYVYIPLGGNRGSVFRQKRNIWITFLVSGLWHGAQWKFVIWGGLHSLFYSLEKVIAFRLPRPFSRVGLGKTLGISITFTVTTLAWIFFRAETTSDAWTYLLHLVRLDSPQQPMALDFPILAVTLSAVLLGIDFWTRRYHFPLAHLSKRIGPRTRWLLYYTLLAAILFLRPESSAEFIYFQF